MTISKKHVNINTPVMTLYLCRLLCLQGGASTALMIAAEQGSCEIIKLLLEHGADINAVNTVVIGWNAGFGVLELLAQAMFLNDPRDLRSFYFDNADDNG